MPGLIPVDQPQSYPRWPSVKPSQLPRPFIGDEIDLEMVALSPMAIVLD